MKLNKLIDKIEIVASRGDLPQTVTGLYNDSRQVQAGGLFFAISGNKLDGHQFVAMAKERGAVAAIVERFTDDNIPQIKVNNIRLVLAKLANVFYDYPSEKLKLVGITATNGKTSTAFMLDQIVTAADKKRAIIGTVMTEFEGVKIASILTTPDALELQQRFAQMVEKDIEVATMEVSSIALEQQRVAGSDFDIVAFNNLSSEHLESHGTFEAYKAAKQKLIVEAKADAFAVLNLDDAYVKGLLNKTKAKTITYSFADQSADLYVKDFDMKTAFPRFKIVLQRDIDSLAGKYTATEFDIEMSVTGFHSVINGLAAVGMAIALGIDKSAIESGLNNYSGVERRCQIVYNRDFKIIDDHFANSGNIDVTMKTLSLIDYHKIVFVYAIRGSRGIVTNRENAEKIVYWTKKMGIKKIYLSLSQGLVGDKDIVTEEEREVCETVLKEANMEYQLFPKLEDAIAIALQKVADDDILLLAGCQGMDCGAHIALNSLAANSPDKKAILEPIENRVCCQEVDLER